MLKQLILLLLNLFFIIVSYLAQIVLPFVTVWILTSLLSKRYYHWISKDNVAAFIVIYIVIFSLQTLLFGYPFSKFVIEEKWGYINRAEHFVIPPRYQEVCNFANNRALVKVCHPNPLFYFSNSVSYIDRKGHFQEWEDYFEYECAQQRTTIWKQVPFSNSQDEKSYYTDPRYPQCSGIGRFKSGLAPCRTWVLFDRFHCERACGPIFNCYNYSN